MKLYELVERTCWPELTKRPQARSANITKTVADILSAVREWGDPSIKEFSMRFDGAVPAEVRVSVSTRNRAAEEVDPALCLALEQAIANITAYHRSQIQPETAVVTSKGVTCFQRTVPIDRVGFYIPAGTAPLFSTLIMLAVPARVAGCKEVVLFTPGGKPGTLNAVIAKTAQLLDIEEIYLIGGAQAVGAMAFGTGTIKAVNKVCGPGNAFVTEAKLQVAAQGVAIDMPAGPSEVLVIADEGANPRFIAADLLAQAEHGHDSQVVLVTTARKLTDQVLSEIEIQSQALPRAATVSKALEGSFALIVSSVEEGIEFSNLYAPEHLILSVRDPEPYIKQVKNAGSVFLGYWSAEALGDYASGTNHVLPTNGSARAFSGVSVDTFLKRISFQSVTPEGLEGLAPTVVRLAEAEGLAAHARAVSLRTEGLYG